MMVLEAPVSSTRRAFEPFTSAGTKIVEPMISIGAVVSTAFSASRPTARASSARWAAYLVAALKHRCISVLGILDLHHAFSDAGHHGPVADATLCRVEQHAIAFVVVRSARRPAGDEQCHECRVAHTVILVVYPKPSISTQT